jgi:hypothetical protein
LENQPKVWKISQNFGKSSQYINIKAQFESPKHLQQITIETLKYLQQTMF